MSKKLAFSSVLSVLMMAGFALFGSPASIAATANGIGLGLPLQAEFAPARLAPDLPLLR